jgi:hypothetical protein
VVDFKDKTSEENGTPLNRKNLMAVQGYVNETVSFGNQIVKTNADGQTETIIFEGDKIIKTFVGEKTITQTITFSENEYVKELS